MTVLQGLHGGVAALLICLLLFVDEAGLPLPIAPNEALLLLTGVLIASDAFPLWVIAPATFLAMTIGMYAGYFWARTIGQSGMQALAKRLGATAAYDRVQARLRSASPWGIGVSRMIPGLRPYATLVSGAAGVDIRTFSLGALPALVLWEILWLLAGTLIGLPVAHFLGRFQKVAVRGAILVVLGLVAWFATRHAPPGRGGGIGRVAPRLRASLALAVDAGIVACVVAGSFGIARRIIQVTANVWIELVVAAVALIALLLLGRSIQTPGETLFATDYWHLRQPSPT